MTAFVIAFAIVRCEQGKHLFDTESDADEKAVTYFREMDLIGSFHALVPLVNTSGRDSSGVA